MITHRHKQFAIVAFAIIFFLIFVHHVHKDVRTRRPEGHPLNIEHHHLNHAHDSLEQLTPDTTNIEESTPTDYYENLKGQLAALIQAGVLGTASSDSPEAIEAVNMKDEDSADQVTAPAEISGNYIYDLMRLDTTATEISLTEASMTELATTTWTDTSMMEPLTTESPTTESAELESSTTSNLYAVISHLSFETVTPQPPEHKYSRALVIPRTTKEDINWIDQVFGNDPLLQKAIYTVDKPVEPYILPANKGHEVMAYLTFIVDFYDELPEVCIFMHAHELAWHNNELLDMSSAEMLKHLNLRKVVREGYVNLRCHRYPSCPDHVFPIAKNNSDWAVPEEAIFADAWMEILPAEDVPEVLSQPCCGQFAVSRERIRMLPKAQYVHFQRWLRYTTLEDRLSGRVWEYLYQYIWLGVPQLCPKEHVCYCDLYGVCFGGETAYEDYYAKKAHVDVLQAMSGSQIEAGGNATWPVDYQTMLEQARQAVDDDRRNAFLRGSDPYNRALEVGRLWQEGDGF